MSPDFAVIACRFARAAAAMILWGAFGYLSVFVPSPLATEIAGRLALIRRISVATCILATLALLPALTASIGEGWSDALSGATLRDVTLATGIGRAWLWQMMAALLLAASQIAPTRFHLRMTAATAGLLLASLALGGHAVMQSGPSRLAHQAIDALHGLAAGAWFGSLLPLIPILALLNRPEWRSAASQALRAFSIAGHIAVALVVLTGVANSLFILGWPPGPRSPYLVLLVSKVSVVAIMILIAIANRYILVPRLGRSPRAAIAAIRVGTIAEIALGLAAIALVAAFGMMDPG